MNEYEEQELLIDASMQSAYLMLTGKVNLEELLNRDTNIVALPWDPRKKQSKKDSIKDIDMLIDYYIEKEEYEKCAELVELKKDTVAKD